MKNDVMDTEEEGRMENVVYHIILQRGILDYGLRAMD